MILIIRGFDKDSYSCFFSSGVGSISFTEVTLLGMKKIKGKVDRNNIPPYIMKVFMNPQNPYMNDPITGPIAKPTPVATSARPKYFS